MVKLRSVSTAVSKMLTLDLTWYRDAKGYRLIPAKPIFRPAQSILEARAGVQPARIVRNGGALQSYRPLDAPFPKPLFEDFLKVKTENDVLNFVQRFGPLTHDGLRKKGDVVPAVIEEAKEMSQVLRGRTIARPLGKLNVSIVEGSRLKISPSSLIDAMWLQLVQSSGKFRECEQCRKLFSGLRADARFCSDGCRIKFNNLQRSRSK